MPSPQWERRNAAARAAGYRNYYDYRAHGYGKRPAEAPQYRGGELERLRGHRGGADLQRAVDRHSLVIFHNADRDAQGRFKWVELAVIDRKGNERIYRLTGEHLRGKNLRKLLKDMEKTGAVMQPVKAYLTKRGGGK